MRTDPLLLGDALCRESKRLVNDWHSTTEVLDRAGFECEPECPGFGAALSFDDEGKSVLLTTDASTPDDYVMPVVSWITSGTRTGKCIPTTCDSCGICTYVAPNGSATASGALCFMCAQKAKLAAMGIFERVTDRYPILSKLFGAACVFAATIAVVTAVALLPVWVDVNSGVLLTVVLALGVALMAPAILKACAPVLYYRLGLNI